MSLSQCQKENNFDDPFIVCRIYRSLPEISDQIDRWYPTANNRLQTAVDGQKSVKTAKIFTMRPRARLTGYPRLKGLDCKERVK